MSQASAAAVAPKRRRISDAKKENLMQALTQQEEAKMQKAKYAEVCVLLKSVPYSTLLAVTAFIEQAGDESKAFPRGVKYYGGSLGRSVPTKNMINILASLTGWEVSAMKAINDHPSALRELFLYALGKEQGDEMPEVGMLIAEFHALCKDMYIQCGSRLSTDSLEGRVGENIDWQVPGAAGVGYWYVVARGSDANVPTHVVHRPSFNELEGQPDQDAKSLVALPGPFQTALGDIIIKCNHSMAKVEILHEPTSLTWKPLVRQQAQTRLSKETPTKQLPAEDPNILIDNTYK
eukprot:9735568-Heterocapsa_arctica.AAC.1